MEKDGFSRFEVSEYIQQIKNELANGDEQAARTMVLQIVGDSPSNIR
jgi:hypothetical protein